MQRPHDPLTMASPVAPRGPNSAIFKSNQAGIDQVQSHVCLFAKVPHHRRTSKKAIILYVSACAYESNLGDRSKLIVLAKQLVLARLCQRNRSGAVVLALYLDIYSRLGQEPSQSARCSSSTVACRRSVTRTWPTLILHRPP